VAARTLLGLYNREGVFNNLDDDIAALRPGSIASPSRSKAVLPCSRLARGGRDKTCSAGIGPDAPWDGH
jgi:hypothetical protein